MKNTNKEVKTTSKTTSIEIKNSFNKLEREEINRIVGLLEEMNRAKAKAILQSRNPSNHQPRNN